MIDHVARSIGMDPIELRRRNVIAGASMPFQNASGMTYNDVEPSMTLAHAFDQFDYPAFRAEQAAACSTPGLSGAGKAASAASRRAICCSPVVPNRPCASSGLRVVTHSL